MAPDFGATVEAVRALVLSVSVEGQRSGVDKPNRVSEGSIGGWIHDGATRVLTRISRWTILPATQEDAAELPFPMIPSQDIVIDRARHLAELYAAALLGDVTHPERVRDSKSYGDPLMRRFTDELGELAEYVEYGLALLADSDGGVDGTAGAGAAAHFPVPRFYRDQGF